MYRRMICRRTVKNVVIIKVGITIILMQSRQEIPLSKAGKVCENEKEDSHIY